MCTTIESKCMYVCSARFAVQASLDLYSRILNVIERNNYDNFRKRAFTTKLVYAQYAMYVLCKWFNEYCVTVGEAVDLTVVVPESQQSCRVQKVAIFATYLQ